MLRNIGYILAVIGVLLIVFPMIGFLPILTDWTFTWGDNLSLVIRVGIIVIGLVLMFMARNEPRD